MTGHQVETVTQPQFQLNVVIPAQVVLSRYDLLDPDPGLNKNINQEIIQRLVKNGFRPDDPAFVHPDVGYSPVPAVLLLFLKPSRMFSYKLLQVICKR